MKVLVLSHMYPVPYNQALGIFVHEQVKALKKQGVEVKVVSPKPWTPFPVNRLKSKWKNYDDVPEKRIKDGIEIYHPRYLAFPRKWFFSSSGKRMYRGISEQVRKIHDDFKFDLIHAHVALPDGFAASTLKEDFEVPLLTHIHGQDFQVTLHQGGGCKKALRKTLEKSDKIITVSDKLTDIGREEFGLDDKVEVVSNGISKDKVVLSGRDSGLKKNDSPTILSVSNLIPTKGIDLNLKALSRLRDDYQDIEYKIIGDGRAKSDLEKLVSRFDLEDNVSFLGRKPHSEVMEYMAEADIFSLPSWLEGLGVVYLEAMAHGKPVIACKGEGIDGIVKDGETGLLVEPKSVEEVADALKFLIDNPKEARRLGRKARELVLENYTWEKNAEKTIGLYNEVLDEEK